MPTLGLDTKLVPVESSQTGVGSNSDSDQLADVNVLPPGGAFLRADVLRQSTSTVSAAPAQARHTSVAEAANLNVLDGAVTAGFVRAVATTTASGSASSFGSLGSTIQDLVVDGSPVNDITPNKKIGLPAAAFGAGSYVVVYERTGTTSGPAAGQLSGGTYTADLTVNMIRVHVTAPVAVDIVVSNAVAHADFPQTTLCAGPPVQSVSGHAFIVSEATDPDLVPVTVGAVSIPPTGGADHQHLDAVTLGTVTAEGSDSDSTGTLGASSSTASSYAQAATVCVLASGPACLVGATAVKSRATSTATATAASSTDDGTQLLDVVVAGSTLGNTPARNTVVALDGIGFVVLNEQFCDGAALAACAGKPSSGLTVPAIRVVVTVPGNPTGLTPGAEIIVAEAHSDASYAK